MGAVSVFEAPNIAGASDRAEKAVPIMHLLQSDIRSQGVPVLVAVPSGELDSRKSDLSALSLGDNRFVTYQTEAGYAVDADGLNQSLEQAWEESTESAKSKTNEAVVMMAHAIAGLNPSTTKFNVQALLEGLSGGLRLDGRTSAARESICMAIGKLIRDANRVGAPWARENLVPNLLDTLGSEDRVDRPRVKAAAARALGATYGTHRGAWDEDGYNALEGMLRLGYDLAEISDNDQRIAMERDVHDARNAAGEAFGRAPTTSAQRSEFQREQAVNRHAPHPASRTAGG
jgi:hypothetical protein